MRRLIAALIVATLSMTIPYHAANAWSGRIESNTWTQAGAMAQSRTGAAAAVLYDGTLLVTGGTDEHGNVLNTAELFDPDGSVRDTGAMHVARTGHTATLLYSGYVLVTGGTAADGTVLDVAELYDPTVNAWRVVGAMALPRTGHTATMIASTGEVLIAGGSDGNAALANAEVFSYEAETFSAVLPLASARVAHAAAPVGERGVLLVGGNDENGAPLATAEVVDLVERESSPVGSMREPRAYATASRLLDGNVLIAGGENAAGALATAEIFDHVTGTFKPVPSPGIARSRHLAFVLPNNNNILLVGGSSAGTALDSAELYTPWRSSFAPVPAMSVARTGATGDALDGLGDGRLLVAGGGTREAELYGFATVTTDYLDYYPGDTVNIGGTGWVPGEVVRLTIDNLLSGERTQIVATADSAGKIASSEFSVGLQDAGARFYLTAEGARSIARTVFTDAVQPTTTALSSSTNPSAAGQAVTFTASVTVANGSAVTCGSVTFRNNGVALPGAATVALDSAGRASFTTTALPVGTHSITGAYAKGSGQCQYNASTSSALAQVVKETSATALASSSNPARYNTGTTTLTATVAGATGTPTGTVTFKSGTAPSQTTLGSAPLGNGTAVLSISSLNAGVYDIVAEYSGDSAFLGSQSSTLQQVVNAAATTTVITQRTPSLSTPGQTVQFTVAVSSAAGVPTGAVQVGDGSDSCTATLSSGAGTCQIAFATSGTKAVSASFQPANGNFAASTSAAVQHEVGKIAPKITWTAPADITYGTALDASVLNATADTAGSFAYTPAAGTVLGAGKHTLSAVFTPAGAEYESASVEIQITVAAAPVTVAAPSATRTYGSPNPAFVPSFAGFVNGETAAILTSEPTCSTAATTTSSVAGGPYPITCAGAAAPNYTFAYVDGTLTVTPAAVTVTAADASREYGTANPPFAPSYAGFVAGDTAAVLSSAAECTSPATATSSVAGAPFPISCSGAAADNYVFSYVAGSLALTPAPLSVIANNASRQEGTANPVFTGTVTGIRNSDPITVTYATAATPASAPGNYPITPSVNDGGSGALGNYSVTSVNGTLTVTAAEIDLVVATLTVPGTGVAGSTIQVTESTSNQGTGAADSSITRFYLSSSPALPGQQIGARNVAALAGGALSGPVTTGITLPAGISGTYHVIACADAGGTVSETDETNNCEASAPITVTGTAPTQRAATPVFSPWSGTFTSPKQITISCSTPDVTIYYTTDGSFPSTNSTAYTGPITVSTSTTIKAIAAGSNYLTSYVGVGSYSIVTTAPVMSPLSGTFAVPQTVTMTATPGTTIYYTLDGSTPTTNSAVYTAPLVVAKSTIVKAIAAGNGYAPGAVAVGSYSIRTAAPAIAPFRGTFTSPQSVSLSSSTAGAVIYYTVDGSTPTTASSVYSGPVAIANSTTLKAMAVANGLEASSISVAQYRIVAATPVFSPSPAQFTGSVTVSIASATPGVAIHYTTNGSTPTTASPKYTGPISITQTTTIKAIAVGNGYEASGVGVASYTRR